LLLYLRYFKPGADPEAAARGLARALDENPRPLRPYDLRPERPDTPEPEDLGEGDGGREAETVADMAAEGRLLPDEQAQLREAERAVTNAGRWKAAYEAAAACLGRR
jgi:hypothetical protein